MTYPNLEKNSTILLKYYQRLPFFAELLTTVPGLTHINFQSINQLYQLDKFDDFELKQLFYSILNTQPPLKVLGHYYQSLAFIDELVQLYQIIITNGLQLADLPQTTFKEQDIYTLIKQALSQPTSYQQRVLSFKPANNPYYRLESYPPDLIEQGLLRKLNYQSIPVLTKQPAKIQAYHTLNLKVEVEAVAQQIIASKLALDETLLICLNTDYFPVIKQVFARYQININQTNSLAHYQFLELFLGLLNYWIKPTTTGLIQNLKINAFYLPKAYELATLLDYYEITPATLENFNPVSLKQVPLFQAGELRWLNYLITVTAESLTQLKSQLKQIQAFRTPSEVISYALKLAQDQLNPAELTGFNELKLTLAKLAERFDFDTLTPELLVDFLRLIKPQATDLHNQVIVTNQIDYFYPGVKNCFILGVSNNNFPQINQFTGIIDEIYLAKLPVTSLADRTAQYLSALEKLFQLSENLTVSYAFADYEGKPLTAAYQFEALLKQHQTTFLEYRLAEKHDPLTKTYTINPELFWSLINYDNALGGSVSAYETYTSCQYSYFLKYGLRLQELTLPSFSAATVGTMMHFLMQKIVSTYQKDYPLLTNKQLADILVSNTSELFTVLPQLEPTWRMIWVNFLYQLELWFPFLTDMEAHNRFIPELLEHKFQYTFNFDDLTLHLTGFIDRVDRYQDYFRIIDYKSSSKSLNLNQIIQGQQLQLLTYLYVYQKQTALQPHGVYYCSLPRKLENYPSYSINYRKKKPTVEAVSDQAREDKTFTALRLSGLTTGNPASIYASELHVNDLTLKDNKLGKKALLEFEEISRIVPALYQAITKQIKAGEIDCNPDKSACTYCPFKEICQYYQTEDKQPLIDLSLIKETK